MAKKKTNPLTAKSAEELGEDVKKLREQLFRLRWQSRNGSLENPSRIRAVRRDIARHLTVLNDPKRNTGAGGPS